ncbi:hypothetical protein F8M41_014114 [Gigaspora margarita]|uniref:Uncharacterized protein n=1 Tax=Gigaspora margarita TaxID=4874 RepID=A0A8H3ZYP0_GIGMA|nr:hypothetical protein F8M41_014114 [Gigaspora margarita]
MLNQFNDFFLNRNEIPLTIVPKKKKERKCLQVKPIPLLVTNNNLSIDALEAQIEKLNIEINKINEIIKTQILAKNKLKRRLEEAEDEYQSKKMLTQQKKKRRLHARSHQELFILTIFGIIMNYNFPNFIHLSC